MTRLLVKLRRYSETIADRVLADCGCEDGGRLASLGFIRALAPADRAAEVETKLRDHPAVRMVGPDEGGLSFFTVTAYQTHSTEGGFRSVPHTGNGSTRAFAFDFPVTGPIQVRVFTGLLNRSEPDSPLTYAVALNANQTTNPGGTVTFNVAPPAGKSIRIRNHCEPQPPEHSWHESRHGFNRAQKIPLANTARRIGIADSGDAPHSDHWSYPLPAGQRWHGGMTQDVPTSNPTNSATVNFYGWTDGVRTSFIVKMPGTNPFSAQPPVTAYVDGIETPVTISDYVRPDNGLVWKGYCVATFATAPALGTPVRFVGSEDRCDDFAYVDPNPYFVEGKYSHGSCVLATISAKANNGYGVAGLASEATPALAAICASSDWNNVDIFAGVSALMLLAAPPTETVDGRTGIGPSSVINCSWGVTCGISKAAYDLQNALIGAALDFVVARDVLVVVAAGNDALNFDTYAATVPATSGSSETYTYAPGEYAPFPTVHPSVLTVGGIDERDGLVSFPTGHYLDGNASTSRYGSKVGITACARYYWVAGDLDYWHSEVKVDGYACFGGTSGASPIVAAAAWRVRDINPNLSALEARALLRATGDASRDPSRYDAFFPNAKILNVARAGAKAAALYSPGTVWPHLQFFKPGPWALPSSPTGSTSPPGAPAGTFSDRIATPTDGPWAYTTPGGNTTLTGPVEIDLALYSTDPGATVELQVGGVTKYAGRAPQKIIATATYNGSTANPLTVIARKADGSTAASETYSDVYVTTLAVDSVVPWPFEATWSGAKITGSRVPGTVVTQTAGTAAAVSYPTDTTWEAAANAPAPGVADEYTFSDGTDSLTVTVEYHAPITAVCLTGAAEIGATTYDPADPRLWEIVVTPHSGLNTFAISDGVETVNVEVEGVEVWPLAAATGHGSAADLAPLAASGLPLRDSATAKWCPIRYRANGKPVWIRRS